jgi:oligoribonuclease NrnB/cAMP/cGMP phosphodiesterase (DHH superfamily)
MPTQLLVLYHGGCADGLCAAWIARKLHPEAEFVPVNYGQDPPNVKDRDVLILDFSYPRPVLLDMKQAANRLEVLDHHKTAAAALEGLDFCLFDMTKSGARLAWEWFFPNDKSPWLVDYVEDRDLWAWKLPNSREVNAALRSYPLSFGTFDRFGNESNCVDGLVIEGAAILRDQQNTVDGLVSHAVEVEVQGHKVLCVNATTLVSETAGELAKGRPFGMTWFESDKNERIYSLRSDDNGVDVGEIAKFYGGGGHKRSSGFTVPATGASGLFTKGQAGEHDEGEIKIAIAADVHAGLVHIDFGKPVAWIGLPKSEAEHCGRMILSKASQL